MATDDGRVSRRALLLGTGAAVLAAGAAGVAGVEARWLPGRGRLNAGLGLAGDPVALPDSRPGLVTSGSFVSARRLGARCGWSIAYPKSVAEPLPVVVVLHGRGGDHAYAFGNGLGLDRYLAAGAHRFALASVDGGDTYWHRRSSGEDAGAMVIDEFLPLLAAKGLHTARIGFLGWSMGGFGSLWLATGLGAGRVAAVAAESPAIWHSAGETAPGAFDGPSDFTATDVFTHRAALAGIPVRIDCGTDDGFYPAAHDYAAPLVAPSTSSFRAGAHTVDFWRGCAPAQLRFLATHLE